MTLGSVPRSAPASSSRRFAASAPKLSTVTWALPRLASATATANCLVSATVVKVIRVLSISTCGLAGAGVSTSRDVMTRHRPTPRTNTAIATTATAIAPDGGRIGFWDSSSICRSSHVVLVRPSGWLPGWFPQWHRQLGKRLAARGRDQRVPRAHITPVGGPRVTVVDRQVPRDRARNGHGAPLTCRLPRSWDHLACQRVDHLSYLGQNVFLRPARASAEPVVRQPAVSIWRC
jgi:hypothetical protein